MVCMKWDRFRWDKHDKKHDGDRRGGKGDDKNMPPPEHFWFDMFGLPADGEMTMPMFHDGYRTVDPSADKE
jgi:hypothetical protein